MLVSELLKQYIKKSEKTMYYIDKRTGHGSGWCRGTMNKGNPTLNTTITILGVLGYKVAIVDSSNNIVDIVELDTTD